MGLAGVGADDDEQAVRRLPRSAVASSIRMPMFLVIGGR